jgi:serine/threonine-protein kinase
MGQVWVGRLRGARGFQKLVAIKTLTPARTDANELEQMLTEEARLASLVDHPNVVRTIELGEHDSALYLVMEWVEGESLQHILRRAAGSEPLPLIVGVHLIAQICRGLHAAHELTGPDGELLGVVHRDVSPHNLLVTYSGLAKVADFGIAKAMNEDGLSTRTGEIKGKFAFMAPEQILCAPVDRRTDIFALGIVLYTLTAGQHPFKNHESAAVLHSITSEREVTPPSAFLPDFPGELEAVLLKALRKSRAERWPTALAMLGALQDAMPEAFGTECEAETRAYLARLFGDRAAARSEALRRILLTADVQQLEVASAQAAVPSQSVGSLRAISVDTSEPAPLASAPPLEAFVARSHPSSAPTQIEQAPAARARPRKALAAVGALAVCAVLLAALLAPRQRTASSASSSMEALPAVAVPVRAAPAPTASADAPASDAPDAGVAARAPATPSAAPLPGAQGAPLARPEQRKPRARPPSKPAGKRTASDSELIAPDYAR